MDSLRRFILVFALLLLPVIVSAQERTYTPTCAGSNDTAKFQALITVIAGRQLTIRTPSVQCAVNTLSIPSNITLDNTDGVAISVNSGQTLTVLGPRINPPGKTMFTGPGTVVASGASFQTQAALLDAYAALTVTNDNILQFKAGTITSRTPAQVKTDLALTSSDVGLGNVTNNPQLKIASNLSDLADAAAGRLNLGVAIGSQVQPWNVVLDALVLKVVPSGALVGTTDTQTLSAKSIDAFTNPITNLTTFQFATNIVDCDATLSANSSTRLPCQSAVKTYVDSVAGTGFQPKTPVRVATLIDGTLATEFENGDTVDGVVLATNDRILVKNQNFLTENGIRVVQASGTPTRATDADTGAEIFHATMLVTAGSQSNTTWANNNAVTPTIGVDDITFAQTGGASSYTASDGVDINTLNITFDPATVSAGSIAASKITGTAATLAGSESLSNKTLITPTIASFTNAAHTHTNAAGGSQLSLASFTNTTGTGAVVGANTPVVDQPVFLTHAQSPILVGGAGTTSSLKLRSTLGVGAAGADIIFQVGNGGLTEAMRVLNSGLVGIGTASPSWDLHVSKSVAAGAVRSVVQNTSATAGSDARFTALANNGDAEIALETTAGFSWRVGLDNTDGKFKINYGAALGASDRFILDSSGNLNITGNLVVAGTCTAGGVSCSGGGGGGSGTVTTMSVVTANGLSGTVSNPTTTPAITLDIASLAATKLTGTISPDRLGSGSALQVYRRNAGNTAGEFITLTGGGDVLRLNNGSDFDNLVTTFTNLKQSATTSVTGVVRVSSTPSGTPTAVETGDPRIPQATGGRVVYAEKYAGADVGAKVNAADVDCGADPCTIVLSGGGNIATQIVISANHTLYRAGGNYTATAYGPVIRLKGNATLDGGGWDGWFQESTALLHPVLGTSPLTVVANYYGTSTDALNGAGIDEGFTVRNVRIKGHTHILTQDGAMTASSATLTSATAAFTANHVGWTCGIVGAGAAGANFRTTISAYISATQVTLAGAASTTVSGKYLECARYDSAAQNISFLNARNGSLTNSWVENGHTIGAGVGGGSMGDGTVFPAITGATNATPIVITAAGHGLSDNQRVLIASVGGNTAANGRWFVKVLTPNTFQLNYSVGSGSYTSGGTITRIRFAENIILAGNLFTGVASQVIGITNARTVRVDNNVIKGAGQALGPGSVPIDVEPNINDLIQNIDITNNLIDLTTTPENFEGGVPVTHAIAIQNGNATLRFGPVNVEGNTVIGGSSANAVFNNTSGACLVLETAQNTSARNNFFRRCQYGVYLNNSDYNWIERNTLVNVGPSTNQAIKVEDSEFNEINFNAIYNDPSDALTGSVDRTIEETDTSNNNRYKDNDNGTTTLIGAASRCWGNCSGLSVAVASSITPTGSLTTITGAGTISTVVATALTIGQTIQFVTAGIVTFDEAGNLDITGATSLTTSAGSLVIGVWDGSKLRIR